MDEIQSIIIIVCSQKFPYFNTTPALYLRGYGMDFWRLSPINLWKKDEKVVMKSDQKYTQIFTLAKVLLIMINLIILWYDLYFQGAGDDIPGGATLVFLVEMIAFHDTPKNPRKEMWGNTWVGKNLTWIRYMENSRIVINFLFDGSNSRTKFVIKFSVWEVNPFSNWNEQ